MSNTSITEKNYADLLGLFVSNPEVEEAWLFSSRAKGTYKKGSDNNLAIKGDGCNPGLALTMANIANEELPIPYQVDIIDNRSIDNPAFIEQIDRVGLLFYSRSKKAAI
jgi:uncharacterized protein